MPLHRRLLPAVAELAFLATAVLAAFPATADRVPGGDDPDLLRLADVFDLEWASDPRISPDGSRVVYVRGSMDRMTDRRRSELWIVDVASGEHRPLTGGDADAGAVDASSPRWSPDGDRLLYLVNDGDSTQIHLRWMDTGQTARLTRLTGSPGGLAWSPDGRWIAFTQRTPQHREPYVDLPKPPEGAEWAEPPKVIDRLIYRVDGQGYVDRGQPQLYLLSAEGGTPRQLTEGPSRHDGPPAWTPAGDALIFSAFRQPEWEYEPQDSDLYELRLADGSIRRLTDRVGPDQEPAVSPDGRRIAYVGYDDRYQGYQVAGLYVMARDGGEPRLVTAELDRSVSSPSWSADGRWIYFAYTDRGNTKIGRVSPDGGEVEVVASDVGGTSLGRPYPGGSFSVGGDGRVAFTHTRPDHPADVAVAVAGEPVRRLTRLNDDLLGHKRLGKVEELWWSSSHDGRRIQGWLATPPDFDPAKKYPLILEIHGGPFSDYGDRWSTEVQLYAAAGYAVLYANPRGSSGYGGEFGNLIHHAYPGNDYHDLMSGVDAVVDPGVADPERLFVTGGSGGGVLSAWIVGKTDRFRAAVVAKPVINWTSFVLTADFPNFFHRYWFPGFPWEHPEHYFARSPLSLVGEVETPTMLLTGEADYRTPISESEQLYQALKLRRVDTLLVRIPGASHGIARRPSQLMAKVAHVLRWFGIHGGPAHGGPDAGDRSSPPTGE